MAMGPVQLLVLGFRNPDFRGEIVGEIERLVESDMVRLIDGLAVYKDGMGELEVMHLRNISRDEAIAAGSKVADLVGLEIEGEISVTRIESTDRPTDSNAWDVLEEIPRNTAAALLLIEHRWAHPSFWAPFVLFGG